MIYLDVILPVPIPQVPLQYMYFANAVKQCPDYWEDEDRIRADLELEATGNDKIETFLAMVRAQRALVQQLTLACSKRKKTRCTGT